jgi:hypothetical protein
MDITTAPPEGVTGPSSIGTLRGAMRDIVVTMYERYRDGRRAAPADWTSRETTTFLGRSKEMT